MCKSLNEQTYQKVRFIRNALRPQKFGAVFCWEKLYPLRRRLFAVPIFQKTQAQNTSLQRNAIYSTQQSLHDLRINTVIGLSNHPRLRQDRNNPSAETQRSLSISYRFAYISRSVDLAALSSENSATVSAKAQATSRQTALVDDAEALFTYPHYL